MKTSVDDCKIINLRKIADPRGNLTVVENSRDIPFEIKRVYYIYDVPTSSYRGAHAHNKLEQVMIAISGSFTVRVDDGSSKKLILLNKPFESLYVPKMIWSDMMDFSSGAVCLVLASEFYDENDYIRDYDIFIRLKDELIE
jgi:dTDP-4-dehydrorhamnose 3,5-epimerase-like enzyme